MTIAQHIKSRFTLRYISICNFMNYSSDEDEDDLEEEEDYEVECPRLWWITMIY